MAASDGFKDSIKKVLEDSKEPLPVSTIAFRAQKSGFAVRCALQLMEKEGIMKKHEPKTRTKRVGGFKRKSATSWSLI